MGGRERWEEVKGVRRWWEVVGGRERLWVAIDDRRWWEMMRSSELIGGDEMWWEGFV